MPKNTNKHKAIKKLIDVKPPPKEEVIMSKLVSALDMISNGLNSIAFARTRNFQRNLKRYTLSSWNDRWAIIGKRFRNAYYTVVKQY